MSFLDETVDFAKEVFDQAVVITTETVEVQKIKLSIAKKKSEINKSFKSLGECYYSVNNGDQSRVEGCELLCEVIAEQKKELRELVLQLEEIKNTRVCTECGAKNSRNTTYCNNCGKKF